MTAHKRGVRKRGPARPNAFPSPVITTTTHPFHVACSKCTPCEPTWLLSSRHVEPTVLRLPCAVAEVATHLRASQLRQGTVEESESALFKAERSLFWSRAECADSKTPWCGSGSVVVPASCAAASRAWLCGALCCFGPAGRHTVLRRAAAHLVRVRVAVLQTLRGCQPRRRGQEGPHGRVRQVRFSVTA